MIHRDVKPANILVDPNDEPHLTDFGLARLSEPEVTVTQDGAILGTPAYMSPEQAAATHSTLDRRSDIYSLGVTLFRMLTGELPFRGSRAMLLNKVMNDEPPSARSLNEAVPQDLDTIALRAMEKSPENRYQTALEFSQELQRWLAGDPILARPISRPERLWRWCRKRPLISSLLGTIVLLLCSISVGAVVWGVRESQMKKAAQASDIQSRERLAGTLASAAADRLIRDDSFGSLPYAVAALEVQQTLESEQSTLTRIQLETTLKNSPRLLQVEDIGESVRDIERRPDGEGFLVSSGSTIRLYDRNRQLRVPTIQAPHVVEYVSFNSTSDRVLAFVPAEGTPDKGIATLWEVDGGKQIAGLEHQGLSDAVFSPDGSQIATVGGDNEASVRIWSAADGRLESEFKQSGSWGQTVRFSADGTRLAVLSYKIVKQREKHWLSIWNLATEEEIKVPIRQYEFQRIAFLNDGNLLTVGESGLLLRYGTDGRIDEGFRLQGESQSHLISVRRTQGPVSRVGRTRLATRRSGAVRIWNVADKQISVGPIRHGGFIDEHGFTVSTDLAMFATAGEHDRVNVFWTASGQQVGPAIGHGTTVRAAEFLGDTLLATGTTSGVLKVWDLSGITRGSLIFKHDHRVADSAFSPDSQRIATTSNDGRSDSKSGKASVWSRETEEKISEIDHGSLALVTGFSPDGKTVISGDFTGALILRDGSGADDERQESVRGPTPPNDVVFANTDSNVFATSDKEGNVHIWNRGKAGPVHSFQHAARVRSLQFDPTGRFLASCSEDTTAVVWNIESGKPASKPLRDTNKLSWCRFSPDGTLLGTSGNSGSVILWDWRTGERKVTFASIGRQQMFDFSPDATQVCSANNFGFIQIWNVDDDAQPSWSFPHPVVNSVDWHPTLPIVLAAGGHHSDMEPGSARMWNAASGLPLSPELAHAATTRGTISPDGTAVLTHSTDTTARVWSIKPTDHDIETLRSMAIVLSGSTMKEQRMVPVPAEEQAEMFEDLQEQLPDEFTPSPKERTRFGILKGLRNQME